MKAQVEKTGPRPGWVGWRLVCFFLIWTNLVQAQEASTPSVSQAGLEATGEASAPNAEAIPSTAGETIVDTSATPRAAGETIADTSATSVLGVDTPSTFATEIPLDTSTSDSFFSIMMKLGLGLGLVILLAWGAVWLLRRSSLGQQLGGAGQVIRVVERSFLGPKKAIYLVEIGGRILALGVTEENISALTEWQEGELELKPLQPPAQSFANHFKSVLGQVGNSTKAREV